MDVLPLELTGAGALRAAAATEREIVRLEGVKVDHLLEFLAHARSVWEPPMVSLPGMEDLVQLGGAGTPEVPDLTLCEVAATLSLSQPAATSLVADALDLGFRLPGTMTALRAGMLPLPRARLIARRTRDLTAAQALAVDERLSESVVTAQGWSPLSARVSWNRLQTLLEQTMLEVRGHEETGEAERRAERTRYLQINPAVDGVAEIYGRLGAEDAARLDARLDEVARWLRTSGDERGTAELRAVAVGYLADPHLLDALEAPASATSAPRGGQVRAGLRSTVLYLHLDAASGTWCDERSGAISKAIAEQIVGHSHVTVRPVLDLNATMSYTGYVAPPRLREQLALLNAGYCTFPSCGRRARPGDVDHVQPWSRSDPGGPGWSQPGGGTRTPNTHLLCKRHHRAKTHKRWRVARPAPGIWVWRSPDDAYYLVTNGTTTALNGALQIVQRARSNDRARDDHESDWVGPRWLAEEIARVDPYFRDTG